MYLYAQIYGNYKYISNSTSNSLLLIVLFFENNKVCNCNKFVLLHDLE